MKKFLKILAGLFAVILVAVVFLLYQYGPNYNIFIVPPSTEKYGEIALDRMENGLYAHGEEWTQTKQSALEEIESAEDYEDTYPILEEAIQVAGGEHSFITYPDETENSSTEMATSQANLEEEILVLTLPAFANPDEEANQKYADTINNAIHDNTYEGVVIDLRNNTGGDMGPMVSGISSLIPDGPVLTFKYSNDLTNEAVLENGTLTGGGTSVTVENTEKITDTKVAVLINDLTASSGEMTALALNGLDNVQIFGEESMGLTSGNTPMNLYDDTVMQLTT